MKRAVLVKVCGITRLEDALAAVRYGADALGFNFWPKSKRHISPAAAARIIRQLPPFITPVGLFVNASRAGMARDARRSGVRVLQLHGDEAPSACNGLPWPVIKALPVRDGRWAEQAARYRVSALLLDAPSEGYGGSGQRFDWRHLRRRGEVTVPLLLAGGLTPANVAQAVRLARPYGVDVASGVESAPGVKDARKLAAFIRAAKRV